MGTRPLRVAVTLPGAGWRASALDGKGNPVDQVPMDGPTLATGGDTPSLWYLIERTD